MKKSDGFTHISDLFGSLPALPKPADVSAPAVKKITREQQKLINASAAISLDALDVDPAFMARQLVQCTLPHTNPGDVPQWARKCGNVTLGIQPGRDFEKNISVGYPYGSLPRLILFWVNTEAVRTKKRRLHLGHSFSEFMRELGLDPSRGGKRSDATRLRDQMRRLFASSISFQQTVVLGNSEGNRWLDMKVAPRGELWWHPKEPRQAALWESWIELGEDFFEAITASPVPLDMRALRALKRSPLALDLYAWATYTTFTVSKKGVPRFIPWRALAKQLGTDYTEISNFKKKAGPTLRKVQAVYPALKITPGDGGFTIHPSRPAVLPRRLPSA
ncbi:MAG: replication protein RepA [Micropepsaceae bacterium]